MGQEIFCEISFFCILRNLIRDFSYSFELGSWRGSERDMALEQHATKNSIKKVRKFEAYTT